MDRIGLDAIRLGLPLPMTPQRPMVDVGPQNPFMGAANTPVDALADLAAIWNRAGGGLGIEKDMYENDRHILSPLVPNSGNVLYNEPSMTVDPRGEQSLKDWLINQLLTNSGQMAGNPGLPGLWYHDPNLLELAVYDRGRTSSSINPFVAVLEEYANLKAKQGAPNLPLEAFRQP